MIGMRIWLPVALLCSGPVHSAVLEAGAGKPFPDFPDGPRSSSHPRQPLISMDGRQLLAHGAAAAYDNISRA